MPDVKLSRSRTRVSRTARNGFGVEDWKNQEQKFEGRFVWDAFHGDGSYQWIAGKEKHVFEGQFYSNFKEGYGLVSLPDGSTFEGLFCNNRPFGPGVRTYPDGRQDVGFWCGQRIVRLSRPIDFVVPRLAATSAGKLKLLRFQPIVRYSEEEVDVAAALLMKHGLDPSQSHRLYSDLIHDPRSVFFDRPHLDGAFFVKTTARTNSPRQSVFVADDPQVGLLRFQAIHGTLDGYPAALPGEGEGKSSVAREPEVVSDSETDCGAMKLLSWNRSELCMEMLKQIFRFRSFEEKLTFRISDLMAGIRMKFRKTGEKERSAVHFLRMCSIGPSYIVKDLLCSSEISESLTDSRGNNAVTFAAAADLHEVIDLLLDHGFDVNSINDEGLTPLNLCLIRRLAETASLGNWEVSFLPPNPPAAVETGTCRAVESIPSLDRIFGDGMSARKSRYADACPELDSVFYFEEDEISCDSSCVTVLRYQKYEGEDASTAEIGEVVCPHSVKREEYLRSVAEPTHRDRYLFDLNPEKEEGNSSEALPRKDQSDEDVSEDRIVVMDRTIQQLLRRGADPNLGDVPKPSLHLAVHSKDLGLVHLLLTYGAAPDSQTLPQEGLLTPLHVVVLMKPGPEQVAMCELLVKHGASPEEETAPDFALVDEWLSDPEHGRTPLQLLCTRGDAEYSDPKGFLTQLALLLARVSKKNHFFTGHSYLTLAMVSGNYTIAKALLASKMVDPNQVLGNDLGTALHVLVSAQMQKRTLFEDSIRMCDLLLEYGANPKFKFHRPRSLLGNCIDYGYREIERERKVEEGNKSDGRNYLEDHLRVVEYLESRSGGGSRRGAMTKFGGRKAVAGGDRTRESYENDSTGEGTTGTRRKKEEAEELDILDAKRTESRGMAEGRNGEERADGRGRGEGQENGRGKIGGRGGGGGSDQTENTRKIIEIKKHVEKGRKRKTGGGKEEKVERKGKKEGGRRETRSRNLSKEQGKTRGSEMSGSERLPERFRQSLLHMFGICGERLDLNDFLLPYVVLRNGDLYYRFKGQKPAETEQYSLI